MNEEKLSPEQSLLVIQNMIAKAKQDISDKSKYFLLWGWLIAVALTGQFILKTLLKYEQYYYVWILLFVGMVISFYWGRQDSKKAKSVTYVDESMRYLWSGMAITFFIMPVLFAFMKDGWQYCLPFYCLMYGLGTFITGRLLRFTPFVIGGICAWIISIVAIRVDIDYQTLYAAAALMVSYIIPAYIFRMKFKKQNV